MFKHIVIWKLKDHARGGGKAENAQLLKKKLEELSDKIPQIVRIEAGLNMSASDASGDVVLYSEFKSLGDYETYQRHPDHVELLSFLKEIVEWRAVVDYEV